jgi:serine/threonine protein kinase
MNELAGQNLGGYQLEEEIGRGSMGVVYRGKQIALEREVAIKVLPQALARDASYVARFIREAQIIAGLNHPNIVQIYDAGQQNRLLYFVMEYVQGPTLASLLHLDGIIPQHLAVEYAAQIADALDCAYSERHVIHRDIKPENLMLNRWGKIKVMDFGLARATGYQRITVAKTLVGSIYYASPEQIWGQTLDNRSDIYALGVVLYEMVSGHRPFTGRSMPELTQAITGGPLQPPSVYNPELSPELEQIILNAMARNRDQRYTEARLLAEHLRSLHLQPPALPPLSKTGVTKTSFPQAGRTPIVIHPPKRPQQKRPLAQDTSVHDARPTQHVPPTAHTDTAATQIAATESYPPIGTIKVYREYRDTTATPPPVASAHTSTSEEQPEGQANRSFWGQFTRWLRPRSATQKQA